MTGDGSGEIEGVATIRALRKALDASPDRPCDVLIWLTKPWEPLTTHQESMGKGCNTVYDKIIDDLKARGVTVLVDPVMGG